MKPRHAAASRRRASPAAAVSGCGGGRLRNAAAGCAGGRVAGRDVAVLVDARAAPAGAARRARSLRCSAPRRPAAARRRRRCAASASGAAANAGVSRRVGVEQRQQRSIGGGAEAAADVAGVDQRAVAPPGEHQRAEVARAALAGHVADDGEVGVARRLDLQPVARAPAAAVGRRRRAWRRCPRRRARAAASNSASPCSSMWSA